MRGVLLAAAIGLLAHAEVPVSWTGYDQPTSGPLAVRYAGYLQIRYDPFTSRTWLYVSDNPAVVSSIYSMTLLKFDAATGATVKVGTSGGTGTNPCVADSATWLGDRHPIGQSWVDTRRHRLYVLGGVCSGQGRDSMYYYDLAADNGQWTQVTGLSAYPWTITGRTWQHATCVYSEELDAVFCYGYDGAAQAWNNLIYCQTALNPTPGALTANQVAAGCAADTWATVTLSAPGMPSGSRFPTQVLIPGHKTILFGGHDGTAPKAETWEYDILARKWSLKISGSPPAPPNGSGVHATPPLAYNASNGLVYYLDFVSGDLWAYNPTLNGWTNYGYTGGPRQAVQYSTTETMAFDSGRNALVLWSQGPSSVSARIWVAQFATPLTGRRLRGGAAIRGRFR